MDTGAGAASATAKRAHNSSKRGKATMFGFQVSVEHKQTQICEVGLGLNMEEKVSSSSTTPHRSFVLLRHCSYETPFLLAIATTR